MNPKPEIILYFDGVCGLCNAWVDFIMKFDKKTAFLFSPLQSEYAKSQLPLELRKELSTVVLQMDGQILVKSDAAFKILEMLGGVWIIFSWGRFIPRGLRDGVYDLVARYRYSLFGKRETCRLPTEQERKRFRL